MSANQLFLLCRWIAFSVLSHRENREILLFEATTEVNSQQTGLSLKSLSVIGSGNLRRDKVWCAWLMHLLCSFCLHAAPADMCVLAWMRGNLWILFEKQIFGKICSHPLQSSHFILSESKAESSRWLSCEVRHQLHLQTRVQNAGPCALIKP